MIEFEPLRVLYSFGILKIYTWGVLAALGFLISTLLAARYAKKKGKSEDLIYNLAILVLIGGFLGARIFYVLFNLSDYGSFFDLLKIWEGGVSSYGGIIGGILVASIYLKIKKVNFWEYADIFAPYLFLGLAFGRLGCFLNWDDYGIASNLPWAVKVGEDVARHPTQIYHLFTDLIIFFSLLRLRRLKRFDGYLFLMGLGLFGVLRIFVEVFRDYSLGIKLASIVGLAIVALGSFLIIKRRS